jgi:hypothetical protein
LSTRKLPALRIVELEERAELPADALEVRGELVLAEHRPFGVAPRRVADASGPAARERDGTVPGALQPRHRHHPDEVAGVQGRCGRVEAHVEGDATGGERLTQRGLVGDVLDQAARTQQFEGAGHAVEGVHGPRR